VDRVNVVGIAISYGLNSPGTASRSRRYFQHTSRPALGPIQPLVQWELGFFQGGKAPRRVDHPALSSAEVKEQSYTFIPPLGLHGLLEGELYLLQLLSPLRLQFKTMKRRTREHKTMTMKSSIYTYMRPLYLVMHIHKTIHWSWKHISVEPIRNMDTLDMISSLKN